MNAHLATINLFEEHSDRVIYGGEPEDEALQNAVDWVFRTKDDDFRSALYAIIAETWTKCGAAARFLFTQNVIEKELARG